MTKFTDLPTAGSQVILSGRTVYMPTDKQMESIYSQAQAFYPWYRICPVYGDIITVDTRPGKKFVVKGASSAISRDRWICKINEIASIDQGVLILSDHFEWLIYLPGATNVDGLDECSISELEIIGQAKLVFALQTPLS